MPTAIAARCTSGREYHIDAGQVSQNWSDGEYSQPAGIDDGGWHTHGALLTPDWIIVYFDGVEQKRFPMLPEFAGPMFMLLSLQGLDQEFQPGGEPHRYVCRLRAGVSAPVDGLVDCSKARRRSLLFRTDSARPSQGVVPPWQCSLRSRRLATSPAARMSHATVELSLRLRRSDADRQRRGRRAPLRQDIRSEAPSYLDGVCGGNDESSQDLSADECVDGQHDGAGKPTISFNGDPFAGTNLPDPGRQIVGGPGTPIIFDIGSDVFAFSSAVFGVDALQFVTALSADLPTTGFNVVVLQLALLCC